MIYTRFRMEMTCEPARHYRHSRLYVTRLRRSLLEISNNSHHLTASIRLIQNISNGPRIIEDSFSRPQSNTNVRTSDCGRSYCEQVANYPSKTILKLLDKTDILPGTFDSIERQGKRSLREEYSSNIKSKKENFNLINLIKR